MTKSQAQLRILFWIAAYQIFFTYIYMYWASPKFWYLGLTHYSSDLFEFGTSVLMVFAAGLVLGTRVTRFSDFTCWILYIVIFLPAMLILPLQDPVRGSPLVITVSLFLSFILIVLIPRLLVLQESAGIRQISSRQFFGLFLLFYMVCSVIMVGTYWNVMSISSLADIYVQRSLASSASGSIFAVYATSWLLNALNPFLITVGLIDRTRRWCLAVGVVGQILVYSVFAGKSALIGVLVMLGFYKFCIVNNSISISRLLTIVFGFMAVCLCCVIILDVFGLTNDSIPGMILALVYMRTFSLPAAFNGVYATFFETNPWTLYSHINIVSSVVNYPYTEALGYVIGRYIIDLIGGDGYFNANANFWATDGTAALGNGGVLIMGVVVGVALSVANKFGSERKLLFVSTLSIPYLISLTNGGFFTSLLTGGGILLIMLVGYGIPGVSIKSNKIL